LISIYDYARDISGIGVGKEIREEDFIVLMEKCDIEVLLLKFKQKNIEIIKRTSLG